MNTVRGTVILCLLVAGGFCMLLLDSSSQQGPDIDAYALRAMRDCADEAQKTECYEREVPAFLSELSVNQVFDVIRTIRDQDASYQFCHVLAHKIGERIVAEDPSKWIEAIPYNPVDGLCSNGYIHGVIGGRFRAEVLDESTLEGLISDFSRACESQPGWNPSPLDQAICYHGMGHLYVFITDADLPKALSLCERTSRGSDSRQDFRRVCREGVFMQIYQPLEPDDFLMIERMSVKPTKDTVRGFCSQYERDEYEGACLRESWPFFNEEIESGVGVAAFCSGQPNAQEETACYESAFSILGRMSLGDSEHIRKACGEVPEPRRAMCYEYGAQTMLEEDRNSGETAITLCQSIPETYRSECLSSLVSKVNFNFGDREQAENFCGLMPADMKKECINRIRVQ